MSAGQLRFLWGLEMWLRAGTARPLTFPYVYQSLLGLVDYRHHT